MDDLTNTTDSDLFVITYTSKWNGGDGDHLIEDEVFTDEEDANLRCEELETEDKADEDCCWYYVRKVGPGETLVLREYDYDY